MFCKACIPTPGLGPLPAGDGREHGAAVLRFPARWLSLAINQSPDWSQLGAVAVVDVAKMKGFPEDAVVAPSSNRPAHLVLDYRRRVETKMEGAAKVRPKSDGVDHFPLKSLR